MPFASRFLRLETFFEKAVALMAQINIFGIFIKLY